MTRAETPARRRALGGALALVAALVLAAVQPGVGQEAVPTPTPRPGGWVGPLRSYRGSPFVELEVQGQRGLFLLDTGANVSGLDRGWLERAKIQTRAGKESSVGGTTGSLKARKVHLERFDLGTGFFRDASFLSQDFSGFKAPDDGTQVGLIGTDFLNRYRVSFDYKKGEVRLELRHERQPLPKSLVATTVRYPLRLPTVNVRVAGVDLPCRLDSGACYLRDEPLLDINQAALEALRAARIKLSPAGEIRVRGVSGSTRLELWKVERGGLALGPVTLSELTLVVHPHGTLAGKEPLALMSGTLLQRFGLVVVDPFDGLLWVKKR